MRRYTAIPAGLILLFSPAAHAANLAVITNPPTVFNLVVLIVALFGLVGAFRVTDLVRGGLLFKSWQLFVVGFVVLAMAQIAALLHTFEIVNMPSFVVPLLLVLMVGFFAYGVHEARRTLS